MNVFLIPSWYPSHGNPMYGIFIREQAEMLASERPEWKMGVCTWGQGDPANLLWARQPIQNVRKLSRFGRQEANDQVDGNLSTYFQPALSWTKRIRRGNLSGIIRAAELNYQRHVVEVGTPDVLWVQATYPGVFIAKNLAEKYDLTYVVHVRLGGTMFGRLLNDLRGRQSDFLSAVNAANAVTVTSSSHQHSVRDHIKNCSVLPNPVDVDYFKPGEGVNTGILGIGRLEQEKGFDILLQAIKDVPEQKLRIIGRGSQESELKRKIRRLELTDRVSLLGSLSRDEVLREIQQCNFLVLPSRFETFGNVLLEAMACGKPSVATRCGGPESIISQTTGLLCDADATSLSTAMKDMLSKRDQFEEMSIRGEAVDRFASKVWADRVEEILKTACSR